MRSFFLIILITQTAFFHPATAQQWSPQQKELIQHIQTCLDTWHGKVFDRWFSICQPDSNSVFWNTSEGSTNNLASWRKGLEAQIKAGYEYIYTEMRPISVLINRDVAIVHYYMISERLDSGKRIKVEQKRMEVFRKAGNQWILMGGMFVPAT